MEEDKDKSIRRIANQAEEIFKERGRRWDTYFYKVVFAGNVSAIKQVVAYLESEGSTETLDWLFKRNAFEETDHIRKKKSRRMCGYRGVTFIALCLVNLIVTPFFYALHMLSASVLNRKQRRISACIRLPLAYAAFSQKQEMVAFFLSQGGAIDHMDQRGNNIFHYISDLSAVSPDRAIQIFRKTVTEIVDRDSVKTLLEHERNSAGFTAVEYAAKFGSPSLLTQILRQPDIMHNTLFVASKDEVMFNEDRVETSIDASTKVEVVDVSMYEGGRLTDQSTLLNILSDRDIARMSRTDLQIFDDARFIGRWLILKCKQMLCGIVVLHLTDVVLTCLMMYVLAVSFMGINTVNFKSLGVKEYRKVELNELAAWAKNKSFIFRQHAFHERVNNMRAQKQLDWFDDLLDKDEYTAWQLLNASSLDPSLKEDLVSVSGGYTMSTDIFSDTMDILYEHAMKMPELSNATSNLTVARLFPQIIVDFAKELPARKDEFLHGKFFIRDLIKTEANLNDTFYKNFSIIVDNTTIRPFPFVSIDDITDFVCAYNDMSIKQEDLKLALSSGTFRDLQNANVPFGACMFHLVASVVENRTCKVNDRKKVVELFQMQVFFETNAQKKANHITTFIIICAYLYIILDIVERCLFLTKSVVYQTCPQDMIITALRQRVPGSYIRKQFNIHTWLAILVHYHFRDRILNQLQADVDLAETDLDAQSYFAYQRYLGMAFIVAIVVRFLMHIHSLRLLPGIGHFVITTFMMGTNLLHFSAVFGIVLLIFSTLFHILIDDPNCPLEKSEGFVSMQDSLFSTFRLTFAHGNLEPFFSSTPVQLTYVLYVIIVCLLLLNLIIAIMSSTVTEIMADPCREVLWKVQWLKEATSAELAFTVLSLPFRKIRGFGYFSHTKAGYIVKKLPNDKCKIYIECFQCSALHE